MKRISTALPRILLVATTIMLLGCGGGNSISQLANGDATIPGIQAPVQAPVQGAWPSTLPADTVQPWEELDAAGNVIPSERDYFGGKGAAAINGQSEFAAGVERDGSCTSVVENGEALTVISGAGGFTDPAFAWYRLTMGGQQPGVVSCDVNPLPGVESMSEYWVGLADYGNSRWEWHGPYSDHHVRIETTSAVAGGASYLSSFGNLFVAVVVHGGDSCDVVGVSANPLDGADTEAPPQPTGLTLTPVAGGLELSWNDVVDGGLAGYRVYYAEQWFYNGMSAGAHWLDELEGNTRYLLGGVEGITYVRIAAVDLSGNESELSEIEYGTPLSGNAPELELTVSQPSGYLDDAVALSASGAEAYDWDVDGDGVYDITGSPSGSASVDTSATGIIRPSVRGTSSGGTMVACGGVSVIITGNSRPVASAIANPQSGDAPLSVTFTGTAEDTEDDAGSLTYAWDFDGDGAYEAGTDTLTPAPQEYTTVGVYGVKFRVEDSGGAWDVDTVPVQVLPAPDPANTPPTAVLTIGTGEEAGDAPHTVNFDASGSSDPDAGDSIVKYWWDLDGDGSYDKFTTTATYTHIYTSPGIFNAEVMVEDSHGAQDTATVQVTARGWVTTTVDWMGDVDSVVSLVVVDGHPAIAYEADETDDLMYVRATDTSGSAWGDPVVVFENTGGGTNDYASMVVVAGRPAICFRHYIDGSDFDLRYVRANDATGSSWGTSVILDTSKVGMSCSLVVVGGNPAVSYYDWTNKDLKYVRANNATGSSWGTPVTVTSTDDVGRHSHFLVVNGNPAISYLYGSPNYDLMYVRASDATGSSWGTPVIVSDVGSWHSFVVADGRPAICYEDYPDLVYVRADDANGGTWSTPVVIADINPDACSMVIINGNPVISFNYDDFGYVGLVRAVDAQGGSWEATELVDTEHWSGEYMSLVDLGGKAGIAYTKEVDDDEGDFMTLKYAYEID